MSPNWLCAGPRIRDCDGYHQKKKKKKKEEARTLKDVAIGLWQKCYRNELIPKPITLLIAGSRILDKFLKKRSSLQEDEEDGYAQEDTALLQHPDGIHVYTCNLSYIQCFHYALVEGGKGACMRKKGIVHNHILEH